RLAASPRVDALERRAGGFRVPAEAGRKRQALLEREIVGLDREPIEERRHARIRAQLSRRGDAEHDEIEPRELWDAGAPRVARTDRREQILRERQRERALDLVDEHGNRHRRMPEDDVDEELAETLRAGKRALLLPPPLQVELEAQLAQHAVRDRVIPACGRAGLAVLGNLAQIDDGSELALSTKRPDRAPHQARLAGRMGGEDVTEAPFADAAQKLRVGLPLDVACPIRLDRPADDEILSVLDYFRHSGAIVGAKSRVGNVRRRNVTS